MIEKKSNYSVKDASYMFILAIFSPYVAYFIIYMIARLILGNVAFETSFFNEPITSRYISATVCQLSLLGSFFVINKTRKVNCKKALNLNFRLDFKKVLLVITMAIVLLYGFNSLSELFSYVLKSIGYSVSNSTASSFGLTNGYMFLLCTVLIAFLPAICEELVMRGVILNGLKSKGKAFAILLSALMFMILHLSLEQSIYQFIVGIVLAVIVLFSGNLMYSIIFHLFNNFYVLTLGYISTNEVSQAPTFTTAWDYIAPVLLAIVSLFLVYLLLKLFIKCCNTQEQFSQNTDTEISKLQTSTVIVSDKGVEISNNKDMDNSKPKVNFNRDLEQSSFSYLTDKSALIISLFVGIVTWIICVVSYFIN